MGEGYGIIFSKFKRKEGESMNQAKKTQRALLLIISILLTFSVMSVSVSAEPMARYSGEGDLISSMALDGREYRNLKSVATKNIWSYSRPNVSINGKALSVKGTVINGVHYIPLRAAASVLGASYNYSSASRTSTLRLAGLELVATDACYVTYANGRTLFSTTPNVIMSDGRLYIPVSILSKALGMRYSTSEGSVSINGSYKPLISADKFY